MEFFAESGLKRGAFRVVSERAYTIEVGGEWDPTLAQNTILYERGDDGKYSNPQYIYKDADGKIALSAGPVDIPAYTYADGADVIFKSMKRYAAENPAEPEYGEEEPAGEPGEDPSEENRENEGNVPDPENTVSENEDIYPGYPEEPAGAQLTLYNVIFEYTESIVEDTEQLYTISRYQRMPDETPADMRGIPYKILSSEPLVSNYAIRGTMSHQAGKDSEPWIVFEKTENGNYKLSAGTTSYYIKGTDIYYTGGYVNNDWFKSWVFDLDDSQEARDNMNIRVYTVSAASVTIRDVENADLVYLSYGNKGLVADGGFMPEYAGLTLPGYSDKQDIAKEVSTALLYQASMRNLPVMTDYELVKKTGADFRATCAWKASYVLAASDVKAAYNKYVSSYTTDGIVQMTDKDHTWVNKNVYIFNDFVEESLGHTILNYNFITDKENKSYIDDGLQEVKKKIEDTNSERTNPRKITNTRIDEATIIRHILDYGRVGALAAKEDIYILEIEPTNMDVTGKDDHWGTTGVSLQYDLSVEEETVGNTKTSRLMYCKHDNFADSTKPVEHTKVELLTTNGNIHLTQMGTPEFIGKIDDLNSTYDMIFIGDDSTGLYHQSTDARSRTKFNDATMNGLVYFNVGDFGYCNNDRLMGSLASEYKNGVLTHKWNDLYDYDGYKAEDADDEDTTRGRTRFSGNDIRKSDITNIFNFAKAGYPVLFGDNLLNDIGNVRSVNEDYVDNTSHMCEMIEKLLEDSGTKMNTFRISDLLDDTTTAKNRRKLLEKSLGILKPEIVFIDPDLSRGDRWDVKTGSSIDGSDKNFIEVKFRIDDQGSGSADYIAKAYIDLNADGKYADNERIKGGAIRIYDSGSSVAVDDQHLHPGTEYRIVCELNDSPAGVYPWKLMVTQNGNEYRRDGKIAYFLAPVGTRETIKVLQLKSGEHGNKSEYQSLDLEERMNNSNSILGKYLKEARDFELKVTADCSDYIFNGTSTKVPVPDSNNDRKIDDKDYLAVFDQYDMLIVGFGDWFKWGSSDTRANEAAEALLQYIALGKSVLFCHDATSMYNYEGKWGYGLNQYIRSIVGMNRYGIKTMAEEWADNGQMPALKDLLGKQAKDDIWVPRSRTKNSAGDYEKKTLEKSQSQGWTYHSMLRFQNTGNWKWNDEDRANYRSDGKNKVLKFSRLAANNIDDYSTVTIGRTTKVNLLNRGQITEYPYHLPDEMSVKVTHAQYYQLNLDIDDDEDGETDVVVWYTLGDTDNNNSSNRKKVYSISGKDGRNNYFIYNKGNVVYSGQGHWNFSTDQYDDLNGTANPNSEWESKLIVNTIIASYASGTRAAKVHFHETGSYNSRSITSDILPFDASYNADSLEWEKDTIPMTTSGNGVSENRPTMTTYFEIDDTNVVDMKKVYVKFFKEDNATLQNEHEYSEAGTLDVKEIVALTDDGVEVPGYRIEKLEGNEYLLINSEDATNEISNTGRMFKMVYYLDSFDVTSSDLATVTNTPGVRVFMREVVRKRKVVGEGNNGTEATSYSDDILPLIRTRMFDLK